MTRRLLTGMAAYLGLLLFVSQARAQTLTLSPPCGKRGDTVVAVLGSGWPEPDPPCEYLFLFDGVEIAPRQPDGINGPPSAAFQVPMAASIGMHTVRVELRLQEDGSLRKWCQLPFKVVDQNADPWEVHPYNGGTGVDISFNPQNSCDSPQCDHIFLIQTVRTTGSGPSQPPRPIYPSECGFSTSLNADQDAEGNSVDEMEGSRDPYQNGRDIHPERGPETGQGWNTSQRQQPSEMTDEPRMPDEDFPPGIEIINMEFEVNVFCESGAAAGQWLGRYTWTWTRTKGSPNNPFGQATLGPPGTRQQPSATFQQTLDNWRTNPNHPWKKSKPTSSPGATCGP